MSNESSDSETVLSQLKFEYLTSESDAESIQGSFNNESDVLMKKKKKTIKEKNISIPEKIDARDDTIRLANINYAKVL